MDKYIYFKPSLRDILILRRDIQSMTRPLVSNFDSLLHKSSCSPYVGEFNSRLLYNDIADEKLKWEHQLHPFSPWCGLLVIRFSDDKMIQTNWTKLASAVEKMRHDNTTISAILELSPTDDRQYDSMIIGGGLIPHSDKEEIDTMYTLTRMMNEQNGRVPYKCWQSDC